MHAHVFGIKHTLISKIFEGELYRGLIRGGSSPKFDCMVPKLEMGRKRLARCLAPAAGVWGPFLALKIINFNDLLFKKLHFISSTVEHTYDACPKYSELGSFRIIAYLYVSDGSRRLHKESTNKKVQHFLYIAKRNHTLCTLFINRRVNCVFYSISYVLNHPLPTPDLCNGFHHKRLIYG